METRRLAVIMFTDIVGYSEKIHRDEDGALRLLTEHNRVLQHLIERHKGNVIKTIGDSFMADFDSAFNAVSCGAEIQKALVELNADLEAERRVEVRIGIHVGDVIYRENDVFGDGVNVASRIEALAGAGQVFVSADVFSLSYGKVKLPFKEIGSRQLKNIERPMQIYELLWDPARTDEATKPVFTPAPSVSEKRAVKRWLLIAASIGVIAAIALWQGMRISEEKVQKPRLAVVHFSDETGVPRLRQVQIGKIINDAIVQKFYEFPHIQLVSPLRIARAKRDLSIEEGELDRDLSLLEEIGRETGGRLLISGSLKKLGAKLILSAEMNDLEQDALMATFHWEAASEQGLIGASIDSLCLRFQLKIAESFGFEIDRPHDILRVGELTTDDIDAYGHFVKGFELYQSGMLYEGIDELIRATELDSSFALAYSAVACAFSFAKEDSLSDVYSKKALKFRDRFTGISKEALIFRGNAAWYDDDDEKCGENYRLITELYPDDREGYHYYGLFLQYKLRRYQEAIEYYDRAIELSPAYYPIYRDKAYALRETRGVDAAVELLQNYIMENEGGPGVEFARQTIAELRGV